MEGSRMHSTTRSPMCPRPWVSPTDVVVFPSPPLVGVMAVTMTSLPSVRSASREIADRSTLAFHGPYARISSGRSPAASAISVIGLGVASCAISSPDLISSSVERRAWGSKRRLRAVQHPEGAALCDGKTHREPGPGPGRALHVETAADGIHDLLRERETE